jgi:hypothetical protein
VQSTLFRQETGRRLRAISGLVAAEYLDGRYRWMSAFHDPDRRLLDEQIAALADAVESGKITRYRTYAAETAAEYLADGIRPIVILAASEVFEQAVLRCLTPDQQSVLGPFLKAGRAQRELVLHAWLQRAEAAGA